MTLDYELHKDQVEIIANLLRDRMPCTMSLADLVAAGNLGLVDAIRRFDPANGASLKTFVGWRIRGAMLDAIRQETGGRHAVRPITVEISEALDVPSHELTPYDLVEQNDRRKVLAKRLKRLKPSEVTVIDAYLKETPTRELSQRMNRSESLLRQLKQSAIEKLKAA